MIRLTILTIILAITSLVYSQTPAEASLLFESGNYTEALNAYENLLKKKAKDALYNYRAGLSAYHTGEFSKAIPFLGNAGNKYPMRNYYLGNIYFDNYYFQESAVAFEEFVNSITPTDSLYVEVSRKLTQAKLGANFINRVEDVEIVDSVVVDKRNFLSRMPITSDLGSIRQNRLDLGERNEIDNIQYTTQRGDRTYVSEYLNGNSDLFTAIKLLDNWTEKQTIDDLNSEANENYPFLLSDGITLYFASDGEDSMGGYDIFITRLNTTNNSFLRPDNLGMPFNSPFNDYMMVVDELRNVGWFASDRYQPEGKVAIYRFIPNKEKKIVRTENMDSLINRARITNFTRVEIAQDEIPLTKKPQSATQALRIFINNNLSYSGANDFKSNEARNHYFQMQQLVEEMKMIENELTKLRKNYLDISGQQKQTVGQQIFQHEKRLRKLPELIKSHEKNMRNEEIKVL